MYSTKRSKAKQKLGNFPYRHSQTSADNCAFKQFSSSNTSQHRNESSLSETERKCLLYIRDLSLDVGHHEVFEHFCIFGTLKRVNVLQRNQFSKYALILFSSVESIGLALRANPHKLRDKHYHCNKMGSWHLRWNKFDRQNSESNSRFTYPEHDKKNIKKGHQLYCYVYPVAASENVKNFKTELVGNRSALLPQSSKILLYQLRKAEASPGKLTHARSLPSTDIYRQSLLNSMGQNFNFVRHSYTDFMAYKMRHGFYRRVPTNAKISLTAEAYAAQRDQEYMCASFYMPFQ